jgi:hypothetical protein
LVFRRAELVRRWKQRYCVGIKKEEEGEGDDWGEVEYLLTPGFGLGWGELGEREEEEEEGVRDACGWKRFTWKLSLEVAQGYCCSGLQ